jgi:hypothetical protein
LNPTLAWPEASVRLDAAEGVALPDMVVQLMVRPTTGEPPLSSTLTVSGRAPAVFCAPVWPLPEIRLRELVPVAVMVK